MLIAQPSTGFQVLVFGRCSKPGRLAFEPREFVAGVRQLLGFHAQRFLGPILLAGEIVECLPRLTDFGGPFGPDQRQLVIDCFESPTQAVPLSVHSGEKRAPVVHLRSLTQQRPFASEFSASTHNLPFPIGDLAFHSLTELLAILHNGATLLNGLLQGEFVVRRLVKAFQVLLHGFVFLKQLCKRRAALFFLSLRDDDAAFEFIDAFCSHPLLLGLPFEVDGCFAIAVGALAQILEFSEGRAAGTGEDRRRSGVPAILRSFGRTQKVAASAAHVDSTNAGDVESQFPLGLEFGLFAEPDSNLPRLAVDVDFGITSLLQLDAHDESNGKFLLGDAPIRLK